MENNNVLLLSQLTNSLNENFEIFQKAYLEQNKENFDRSKKAILEIQGKINFILTHV